LHKCDGAKLHLFKKTNQAQLQHGTSAMVHLCTIAKLHKGQNMRKLTISINKGGVGKTMCVKSLTTAAADAGLNALALDLDSQRNLATWGKRRNKEGMLFPIVKPINEQDLEEELRRAEKAGCDLVIIDTPPGKNTESLAAMEASDHILIPFWNDQDAYEGVARTWKTAQQLGKTASGVLNFATPNSITHEITAAGVLKGIGLEMAPVVVHRYDVHRQASAMARVAQELEPNSIAAAEIRKLWGWLDQRLQLCTIAQLQ
jgi:chromosome partitioning protein